MFVRDGRTLPFIPITTGALEAIRAAVEVRGQLPYAISVYTALLERANDERAATTEPTSYKVIEELSGASRSSIKRALATLKVAGVVVVHERLAGGRAEHTYELVEPPATVDVEAAVEALAAAIDAHDASSSEQTVGPVRTRGAISETPGPVRTGVEGPVRTHPGSCGDPRPLHVRGSGVEEVLHEEVERERSARGRLLDRLTEHVRSIDPSASIGAEWSMQLQTALHERPVEQLDHVLTLAIADEFWRAKILKPSDLARHATAVLANSKARTSERRRPDRAVRAHQEQVAQAERAGDCCAHPDAAPHAVEDEWRRIVAALREQLTEERYELWIAPLHPHVSGDGQLLLGGPKWLSAYVERFAKPMTAAAGRTIEIVVCQETP